MAVDYIIDYDCKVKQTLTLDGMVSLLKQRNRAMAILRASIIEGKSEEEAKNSTMEFQLVTPEGKTEVKELKVSDLLEKTKSLADLQSLCKGCPANLRDDQGDSFGCYQVVNYPISENAEKWLIELSQTAIAKGGQSYLLLDFILDQKISGERFAKMRGNSMFWESRTPLELQVGKGLVGKKTITTNQLFEVIFGVGRMKRTHMMGVLSFSGGFRAQAGEPTQGTFELAAELTTKEGKKIWLVYSLPKKSDDDRCILGMKEFFKSLFTAYLLGKDMLIEP